MQYVEAFRRYGASLKNPQWSVSAGNSKGELVVSLWHQYFSKPQGSTIRYIDRVSRWSGLGNAEFRRNIEQAFMTSQVVRVVIARTNNPVAVDRGDDASKLKNTFSVKEDWFGRVVVWDGDNFEIEFERM